jgi:hypothetical protein
MSDDFQTVNVRRGERAREFEVLRQKYRTHRESLARLAADAPTERLAADYQRLLADIDGAIRKLEELEGRAPTAPMSAPMAAASAAAAGNRPLVEPPPEDTLADYTPPESGSYDASGVTPGSGSRLGLIIGVVVIALAAIAYMIWRASSDRTPSTKQPAIVEQPATTPINVTQPPAATTQVEPEAAAANTLKVVPAVVDYGVIRKGTRAVRQFEMTNSGTTPLSVSVSRSACRCLYYDYNGKLAPKKRETLTVTVDGSKAKAGALQEQLTVTAKENPASTASFGVQATIK